MNLIPRPAFLGGTKWVHRIWCIWMHNLSEIIYWVYCHFQYYMRVKLLNIKLWTIHYLLVVWKTSLASQISDLPKNALFVYHSQYFVDFYKIFGRIYLIWGMDKLLWWSLSCNDWKYWKKTWKHIEIWLTLYF